LNVQKGHSTELGFVTNVIGYDSRYTFSAKEKDDETQYSYFGARYYDSDLSVWLSVDPMADKYPGISPFAYTYNNPINYRDLFGLEGEPDENSGPAQTDISTLDLSNKTQKLNIIVMGAGNFPQNTDPTSSWSEDDKNNESTIALYVNSANDLDKMLAALRNDYGKEIGNIIFSSHGNGNKSQFFIGKTPISKAKDLNFLKDDLSGSSIVFITACHVGSPKIGGDVLLRGFSNNLGVTVVANQGWSRGGAGPGEQIFSKPTVTTRNSNNRAWATKYAGQFTIAYFSANGTELFQAFDVRLSSTGTVYFNSSTLSPLMNKQGATTSSSYSK
jgi:RHS repeat-associated protein